MDTIPLSITPPPKRKRYLVLASVAFVAMVVLALYYVLVVKKVHPQLDINRPYISAGAFKASTLYTVNEKGQMQALTLEVQGTARSVIDIKKLTDGSTLYIVVDSPQTFTSNLYSKTPEGVVTPITNTHTAKYNLTISPDESHVAYQEATIQKQEELVTKTDWIISELHLGDSSIHTIALGVEPHYVNGGELAFMRGEALFTVASGLQAMASGTERIKTYATAETAINKQGSHFAFVNGKTGQIDEYFIKNDGTFSYKSSMKPVIAPSNMAYIGDMLYATSFSGKGAESTISIRPVSGNTQKSFSYTDPLGLMPQSIYEKE